MKHFLPLFLFALLLSACANEPAGPTAAETAQLTAQESAYGTMMASHDRAMALMGQIVQGQRAIAEQLATPNLAEDRRELLVSVREQLEDANDGMMEWMGGIQTLDELREEEDHDDIMDYIQEQNRTVAAVESNINTAVATANEVLGIGAAHDHGAGGHDHDHSDPNHKH